MYDCIYTVDCIDCVCIIDCIKIAAIVSVGTVCAIPPPDSPDFDEELFLTNMNAYVCEKTGFQTVSFIRKEFEESDILFACIEKRKAIIPTILQTKRKHAEDKKEEDDDEEEDESSWKAGYG